MKYQLNIFSITKEQFDLFREDACFLEFKENCKKTIVQKYGSEIEVSECVFGEYHQIAFLIIKFDKKTYKHLKEELFLKKCTENFLKKIRELYADKNSNFYHFDFCSSILRNATDFFFRHISKSLTNNENKMLFSCIEDLSRLTYEKKKIQGLLLFYSENEIENLEFQFPFTKRKEISKENIKLVRKLLELTNEEDDLGLISDTKYIYGIGKENKNINHYSISFSPNYSWMLKNSKEIILNYKNNKEVTINSEKLLEENLKISFDNVFEKEIDKNFFKVLRQLVNEDKGTILVISNKAEELISEYEDLCIRIEPEQLTKNNISKLSSIDGAIVTDDNGICYGFGVVLDGIDTKKGIQQEVQDIIVLKDFLLSEKKNQKKMMRNY